MDRLRSMPRLSLKMSGRSLGSRLGLSTPVGSNFGQTTINKGVGLQGGAKMSDYLV